MDDPKSLHEKWLFHHCHLFKTGYLGLRFPLQLESTQTWAITAHKNHLDDDGFEGNCFVKSASWGQV